MMNIRTVENFLIKKAALENPERLFIGLRQLQVGWLGL
jgi:hypothetical protein